MAYTLVMAFTLVGAGRRHLGPGSCLAIGLGVSVGSFTTAISPNLTVLLRAGRWSGRCSRDSGHSGADRTTTGCLTGSSAGWPVRSPRPLIGGWVTTDSAGGMCSPPRVIVVVILLSTVYESAPKVEQRPRLNRGVALLAMGLG